MKQSPSSEGNRFLGSREIPRILRNPKVITTFTTARHLALSSTRSIQCIPLHSISWRSFLILFSQVASILQVSPPKPCMHLSSPHTCYMPQPSHSSWFDHPHDTGWAVQNIELFIMLSFPLHYYVVPLRSKYLSHHPNLKLPPPMWPNVRPSFTPTENNRQNFTTRLRVFCRTPEHLSCRDILCSARGDIR